MKIYIATVTYPDGTQRFSQFTDFEEAQQYCMVHDGTGVETRIEVVER